MKKLAIGLVLAMFMQFSFQSSAQVSVNVNIGVQPAWGPVGYDYVEYYYLPDIEMYYSVPARKYIYFSGGRWIWVSSLPSWCRHYDLYSGYKVIINEPRPYMYFNSHKIKYAKYKNYHGKQKVIKSHNRSGHPNIKHGHTPSGVVSSPGHGNHQKGKSGKQGKGHR